MSEVKNLKLGEGFWKNTAYGRELKTMSPEFDHSWKTFFAKYPDKPVVAVFSLSG